MFSLPLYCILPMPSYKCYFLVYRFDLLSGLVSWLKRFGDVSHWRGAKRHTPKIEKRISLVTHFDQCAIRSSYFFFGFVNVSLKGWVIHFFFGVSFASFARPVAVLSSPHSLLTMSDKRLSGSRPSVTTKSSLPHRRASLSLNTTTALATSTATSQSPKLPSESVISPRRSRDQSKSWLPRTFSRGPLLPHDKRSHHHRLPRLLKHRWIQFVILVYATFSVLLTFTHLCRWSFSETAIPEPQVTIKEWEPKRTYRPGKVPYLTPVIDLIPHFFVLNNLLHIP